MNNLNGFTSGLQTMADAAKNASKTVNTVSGLNSTFSSQAFEQPTSVVTGGQGSSSSSKKLAPDNSVGVWPPSVPKLKSDPSFSLLDYSDGNTYYEVNNGENLFYDLKGNTR